MPDFVKLYCQQHGMFQFRPLYRQQHLESRRQKKKIFLSDFANINTEIMPSSHESNLNMHGSTLLF